MQFLRDYAIIHVEIHLSFNAMKENSRTDKAFKRASGCCKDVSLLFEYIPEQLPENFSRVRRVRPIKRVMCDGTYRGVFCEELLKPEVVPR